ncbi:competence/damage-inducible protein A [Tenacibaculum piscium]|uniref:CinA-like protein n=1 Tax=Tenacibaculum piscium TaxID=1458515 RepID=A0A2H1YGA5_9FLAO|nr:competence/damage-inducible protein A [Tenacibaculum piscium]MBE7629685.1 competence/damage-inducible protein A [Tenacibaculum piscium]MBE7671478.1 competence/damage-inducible protein A [Tenacibaculum piscium]MBE7685325.1 competence/damage-inducible protein A [Tenacibaculum piscium]MBE7690601.1 competence/damage-inducible protein A [Tenacibaculum piscium]SOS74401.1 CinA-like protein [Tenacibaculum piscium]
MKKIQNKSVNAEIITIGDEILIGQIVDTNSQWIGQELNKIGVSVYQISSIQDERKHILNALKEAEKRADIVIITGGLGPTKDDITKKTIAEYFKDDKNIEYPEVIEHIKVLFKKVKHPFNEVQKYQAQLPSKATLLMNQFGTAPGMWFYENNTVFVSLPGVPYEMKGLITNEVLPKIQQKYKLPYIIHTTIMTVGVGESVIAERIEDWENNLPIHIKVAYLPSFGKVRLRISAKGNDKEILENEISTKIIALKNLISDIIVGYDTDASIEKRVGDLLSIKNKTVSTAESLTGGKIGASLVAIAGSSAYFKGGFITYTAELKQQLLGVSKQTIQEFSVVSEQVAKEMAMGCLNKLQTDYAIAVTGNAGPTTDVTDKNVGVVYIAIATKNATKNNVEVHEFNFGQPREKVINRTVTKALELLMMSIQEITQETYK